MNETGPLPGEGPRCAAHWFDGIEARPRPVELSVDPSVDPSVQKDALRVRSHARTWLPEAWEVEEIFPDGHFRVRLLPGADGDDAGSGMLEGRDPAFAAWLRGRSRKGFRFARAGWRTLAAWSAALVALCALVYFAVLPFAASAVLASLPRSMDARVGELALAQLAPDTAMPGGAAGEALRKAQALLDDIGRERGLTYRLHWIPDETVNAFALPGGDILLHQGLVKKMKHPSELEGLLGHEAGHVELRHGMGAVVRASILALVAGAALGDGSGGGAAVLLDHASTLAELSYGRRAERAADRFGMRALAARGHRCDGAEKLFARGLSAFPERKWWSLLSTHPSDAERAADLRRAREEEPGCASARATTLSAEDLRALQNAP